jgi:UDP-N-acetylglucosamine--N-acetylmuramyl-(pentapeptide) pyrophosphoryl-undecaprenol N-acetylglucosamine transferase
MAKLQKVLIMAGGTGGHVFPGLAVAKLLQEKGVKVEWLGTRNGLEARLVPESHIPIHYISIAGLRGKGAKEFVLAPWKLMVALFQSIKIIRKIQPDIILGMGGFVSGPGGVASWLLQRPLIIHEQNAKAGLTNQWLARIAKKVLEGFPNTFAPHRQAITTGNPVRAEICNLPDPEVRFKNRAPALRLLVVGGSLGAAAINQLVPKALATMPLEERPEVYHQTGEKHFQETLSAYSKSGVKAEIKSFITEMDEAYAWADIVLCRSGALTVAELCAAGVGAIFVPFPFAVDDHQTANASFMVNNKAACLVQQADLTPEKLVQLLKELQSEREKCFLMAQSAYKSRKIDAAEHVMKICEEICR